MDGMSDTSPPSPAYCDGHEYENVATFDLQNDVDMFAFESRLDTFMEWFDRAHEIVAEEEGHRHFMMRGVEVECNVQKLSDRFRNIYWTIEVDEELKNDERYTEKLRD